MWNGACLLLAKVAAVWAIAFYAMAQESVDECVAQAATRFRVPPSLILAIMDVEGGKTGQVSQNKNGSFDIGPMQINSIWIEQVNRKGGSLELLLYHRCANIHFGTWLLSRELSAVDLTRITPREFWQAIGNYHSRTHHLNTIYARKVWNAWRKRSNH